MESLDGRIQAISRAHGLLRRGAWVGANLAELVSASLSPLPVGEQYRDRRRAREHRARARAVHGAHPARAGDQRRQAWRAVQAERTCQVSWSRAGEGQLQFCGRRRGGLHGATSTKGFGLTVLRTAASDLGATASYDFTDQGFVYTLRGPFEIHELVSASSSEQEATSRLARTPRAAWSNPCRPAAYW